MHCGMLNDFMLTSNSLENPTGWLTITWWCAFVCSCRCPPVIELKETSALCPAVVDCSVSPCVHGMCVPYNQTFYCICEDGWFGTYCNNEQGKAVTAARVGMTISAIIIIIVCILVLLCKYTLHIKIYIYWSQCLCSFWSILQLPVIRYYLSDINYVIFSCHKIEWF